MINYIDYLKRRIKELEEELKNNPNEELGEKLYNLKIELQEKEDYQTLEDLGIQY
jgi:hypothetical protein